MPKLKEGSQAWLDQVYTAAADKVRAYNQVGKAERDISKLLDGWDTLDEDLKSALFTSVVIHYARPFTSGRRGRPFPIKQLRDGPGFDRLLHDHIIDLRNKMVAHQDSTLLKAQIGAYELSFPEHDVTIPVSFFAVTTAFHGLANKEICGRYREHIHAAFQAIHASLNATLGDITQAAHKYPDLRFGSKRVPHFEGKTLPDKLVPPTFEKFVADITMPRSPVPTTDYVWRQDAVTSTPLATYSFQGKDGPVSFEVFKLEPQKG